MRTYAIWNLKGGVGKTVSTVNLAYTFAAVYDKRVLVLDLDPQVNTTPFFAKTGQSQITICDVLEGQSTIRKAIRRSKYKGIDLVAGDPQLSDQGEDFHALYRALVHVKEIYDVVFIDCRPSFESLTKNALCAADEMLVPALLDGFCRDNLLDVQEAYQMMLAINDDLEWCVFANRVKNNRRQRKIYTDLAQKHPYPLYDACINERAAVQNAVDMRKPLLKHSLRNDATLDFVELSGEIIKHSEKVERRIG